MSEKCPICERLVNRGATRCETCGFEDDRGVNREWFNVEDAKRWTETVVKPCRVMWEAARRRMAGLWTELEEAEKQRAALAVPGDTFTDRRDGQRYRTVKIGGLVWMAENLNYETGRSWCYGVDRYNGKKYGRSYDWITAMRACPKGWHLPSIFEWDRLVFAAGGDYIAGKTLKSKSGWRGNGNGTDEFGFSGLPGGARFFVGYLTSPSYTGWWWSATASESGGRRCRYMHYGNDRVGEFSHNVRVGLSVRCVKDN